jgi:ABC-2 type transport system ATP-binding protein
MDALVLEGLVKRYGAVRAVDGLSFSAPTGSIFGVLGPNGAGKSTTMRMIVGILEPDAGRISLLGGMPTRAILRRVGYLPEERGLYRAMTPLAIITYCARLKGLSATEARRRAGRLLEENGLGAWARRKVKALSKGMAQKVQILAAIVHEPELVLFDEPFSGLDPVNQQTVETLIRAIAASGRTVLFSTHVMEHAERMCDRIVLIAHGRSAFEGTVAQALALTPRVATLETDAGFDLATALASSGFALEEDAPHDGRRRWRAPLAGPESSRALLGACVAAGAPLTLFEPQRATLHEAFVRLVGEAAQ